MASAFPQSAACKGPARPSGLEVRSWPRAAQLAVVVLLGLAAGMLLIQAVSSLARTSRPTELVPAEHAGYRIDVNRAGRAELLQVPGVGEGLAQRIADERAARGPFDQVNDLTR